MERNDICTNFVHIIAGTSNTISSAYMEATSNLNDNDKAIKYLKNFISSIESVASKKNAVDKRISDSNGNIRNFVGYDNVEKSLKFLSTHKSPAGNAVISDIKSLYNSLEKYQSLYSEGYSKDVRLVMLEYECSVYLLVTGLSMVLSFGFDVADASGTTRIVPKPKAYFGVTGKKLHEMAEELSKKNHEEYLNQIIKSSSYGSSGEVKEDVSDAIATSVNLIGTMFSAGKHVMSFGVKAVKTIKNTLFGIIPLIQSVIFLSYKRKADTILSLEQNINFIEQNIEILNNRTNMDASAKKEIIKKQRAKIEAYRKRAEKLRAQLEDGEREASEAIKKEHPKMRNTDDDFVLESIETPDEYEEEYVESHNKENDFSYLNDSMSKWHPREKIKDLKQDIDYLYKCCLDLQKSNKKDTLRHKDKLRASLIAYKKQGGNMDGIVTYKVDGPWSTKRSGETRKCSYNDILNRLNNGQDLEDAVMY